VNRLPRFVISPVAAALSLLAAPIAARGQDSLHVDLGPVSAFSLTERSGKTVTRDDLRGKIWVAHFFFRCCSQGCALTTKNLEELQKALAGHPNVVLVSFTLDPESDTPEALRKYADDHGADPNQWLFLTGSEEAIYKLVRSSFHQSVEKDPKADADKKILHQFYLMLVDADGRIRGYVDGRDPDLVHRLADRIRALTARWPALNASLNATCAALLILGYLAIRQRRETLHKICMLSALAVSACFLACYLYYHFAVLHGQATRFQGQGWIRPVYFAVLLSHTGLAIVAAPLAIFTAYLGLRDRRPRHVRWARLTLPIWLYVSVTGVAVYWMLYRM
jgi:uncharacterized membrane protein YozB (DUF420 family)/cytochrome oxidase Cu insertion factor (SCO1/SenC/PrrC family)